MYDKYVNRSMVIRSYTISVRLAWYLYDTYILCTITNIDNTQLDPFKYRYIVTDNDKQLQFHYQIYTSYALDYCNTYRLIKFKW